MKKLFLFSLLALLLTLAPSVWAEELPQAQDITAECTLSSGSSKTGNLRDRKYTSYWRGVKQVHQTLEFSTPEGVSAQYLYICFGEMPSAWAIEEEVDGQWQTLLEGSTDYLHTLLDLGGKTHFRLIDTTGKNAQFKINEVFIFTEGELPDWVQRWEPTAEKADLLLLVAHPDDELIFFGGTIPTYDTELGLNVVVAYMCYSNTTRSSELLNGLWHMGVRNYPVIGDFYDAYSSSLDAAYKNWGKGSVREFVTELIRKHRPEVVLSHDVGGEYGHGAHRLCADAARYCVENSSNPEHAPEIAEAYGLWQVKKLYLHLYEDAPITMDWNVPLASMDGKTGLQLAQEAYQMHVTQQNTDYKVTDTGKTSCAEFGLVYSSVGADVSRNDFFENIPVSALSIADSCENPDALGLIPGKPQAEPVQPYADVLWPEEGQEKDEKGYLLSGEYVYENPEEGVWFYASPSLVVRVDRFFDEAAVNTWYEAHIFCDTARERFGAVLHNPENPRKAHVQASQIAREKQVVFAMNTDYYTYRLDNPIIGMIIRNQKVFFDSVPKANRSKFPNLDTLAMYLDGSWSVFQSDELTAREYLVDNAVDVFAFGPYLIRNGEINPFIAKMSNGKTGQPRCAVGMIERGHYYAVLGEGRIRGEADGVTVEWLALNAQEKGCSVAFNLDGGQTAVMTFMGNQITRIGKYDGGKTAARTTTEILGIGHSELIDPAAE